MKKILCEVIPHGTIVNLIPFKRIEEPTKLELDRSDILYAMKKGTVKAIINGQKYLIATPKDIDRFMSDGVDGKRTVHVKVEEKVEVEERVEPKEETPVEETPVSQKQNNTKNNKRR